MQIDGSGILQQRLAAQLQGIKTLRMEGSGAVFADGDITIRSA